MLLGAKRMDLEPSFDIECRDASDIKFLQLALHAKADCIVSVDLDLIVLNPLKRIPILTPSEFVNRFS
jgi:putative PIN family toxin of toxin-antitoxin system